MVGASGAISGVMGAYIVLYPRVRVFMLVPLGFYVTSMAWPAWMMLGYWLLIQFVSGLTALGREGGGVAFWAHFGGFVAGVVLIKLFARPDYLAEHQSRHWHPRRLGFGCVARGSPRIDAPVERGARLPSVARHARSTMKPAPGT